MTHRFPRPPILDQIPRDRHCVIEASAGTGKTFTLEHLVVDLILEGVPIEQILVVTFTEKATREMRQRIRHKLEQISAVPGSAAAPTEPPPASASWLVDDVAAARLRTALLAFDRAPISTIHAFCQRVLGEHAFDGRRLFEQEAVAARDAFARALRDELRTVLGARDDLAATVQLVLGERRYSGLEDVLFRWYSERGTPEPALDLAAAEAALARLRDPRAAGDLARALRATPRADSRDSVLRTLGGAIELAKAMPAHLQAPDLPALWHWAAEDTNKSNTHAEYLRRTVIDKVAAVDAELGSLVAAARALAERSGSPLVVLVQVLLPRVRARLAQTKERAGQLDFDDMLAQVDRALGGAAGEKLLRELRSRFRCALVDEFQDTDEIQWAIFRRVFFDGAEGHRLVVIGDPKQAIYAFRNADVHTYLSARAEIVARGGELVHLVDNYRSTPALVGAYNRVLAAELFDGDNAYDHPVRAARRDLSLRDPRGREPAPVVLMHAVGDTPLDRRSISTALAEWAAREIRRIVDGPEALTLVEAGQERRLGYHDVYVLTRTFTEGREVAEVLRRHGLPFAFFRQEGLFQTAEAGHVRDLLAAIEDPADASRRYRAWLTPFFDVPLEDLPRCRDLPPSDPLVERLYRWRSVAVTHDFARLFESIVEESGVVRRLLALGSGERELTNYTHVLELLLEQAHRRRLAIGDLLRVLGDWIGGRSRPTATDADVMRLESEKHAVQLLTMHKAKGLEAPVVFVLGGLSASRSTGGEPRVFHRDGHRHAWIDKPPPEVSRRVQRDDAEEQQRLLYVAMTRAKTRLYLPYLGQPPSHAARAGAFYKFKNLHGPTRTVNGALERLVEQGALTESASPFERVELPVRRAHVLVAGADAPPSPVTLAAELLAPVDDDRDAYASLRARHAGFDITSYTRLAHARGARAPEAPLRDEFASDAVEAQPAELAATVLRPGAATGIFLHELLEVVDYAAALAAPDLATWAVRPEVRSAVRAAALRNGIPELAEDHALAVAWRTLRSPIDVGGLVLPRGLAALEHRAAEMPMLYPIPERAHPALGAEVDRPLVIERGLVRGVVDLVFEHAERVWFLDWKSDLLPSYARDALGAHVSASYSLQAKLYTLGIVRMLGVHDASAYDARFGGLLYCFLRAMGGDAGTGVYFERPAFDAVRAWDHELRESELPFGVPLPHGGGAGTGAAR